MLVGDILLMLAPHCPSIVLVSLPILLFGPNSKLLIFRKLSSPYLFSLPKVYGTLEHCPIKAHSMSYKTCCNDVKDKESNLLSEKLITYTRMNDQAINSNTKQN